MPTMWLALEKATLADPLLLACLLSPTGAMSLKMIDLSAPQDTICSGELPDKNLTAVMDEEWSSRVVRKLKLISSK